VKSTKVKIAGKSLQGYQRAELWDPWQRYVPPVPAETELRNRASQRHRIRFRTCKRFRNLGNPGADVTVSTAPTRPKRWRSAAEWRTASDREVERGAGEGIQLFIDLGLDETPASPERRSA
jgi:hypothetical protein